MNYAAIKTTDVANGPGVRVSLFVSGCTHHCPGCFNAVTWDFSYGEAYTAETEATILAALGHDYIKGFTFLGGEPFEYANRSTVLALTKRIREVYPDKTIWAYSGYLFEDLCVWAGLISPDATAGRSNEYDQPYLAEAPARDAEELAELLSLIDVLVDGRFIESKKNLRLQFRGSENQRIIDVPESLRKDHVVLYTK